MEFAINLTAGQLASLARLAKDALPREACALLLGSGRDSDLEAEEIMPMTNIDESPFSFSIDPTELLRAYDSAEKRRLQVIAVFHSHPGKPSPSGTDVRYMELNPVVWLIYSSTENRFDAYISAGDVMQVSVRIKD